MAGGRGMQLAICVPHLGDHVPVYFMRSVVNMVKPPAAPYWFDVGGYPVDIARNMLAMGALETDATHVLFMDSDMEFPREMLARLVMAGKPIVSGLYFARTEVPVPHAYDFHERDDAGVERYISKGREVRDWIRANPGAAGNCGVWGEPWLVKAAAIGAGCMLIERKVLEHVYAEFGAADPRYPWFRNADGSKGGEDFEFCRRASRCGYEIWVDLSVQCAHEARGGFIGREEFEVAAGIGTEREHPFELDPVVMELPGPGKRYTGVGA